MSLTEEIQQQYNKLKFGTKTAFIEKLAKVVGKSFNTIRNHWLCEFCHPPQEYQQIVLDEINKELKLQSDGNTN